jgi:hypothetical protein
VRIPGVNFGELLARLGIQRGGWSFELAEQVQPVGVVFDASALVPPLLPAMAFFGGQPAAGANAPGAQLRSIAPGGTYVRTVAMTPSGGAAGQIVYALLPAPLVFAASVLPAAHNMGPQPVQAVLEIGDIAPSLDVTQNPVVRYSGPNIRTVLVEEFFVPPGMTLYFEGRVGGIAIAWAFTVSEVPAAPGAA